MGSASLWCPVPLHCLSSFGQAFSARERFTLLHLPQAHPGSPRGKKMERQLWLTLHPNWLCAFGQITVALCPQFPPTKMGMEQFLTQRPDSRRY